MAALNTFAVVSGVFFVIFIIGLHNFITSNEENGCEMTYMFEYPQFVRISLPGDIARKYSRYGLYAYGEGHMTERLRHMRFSGIPVLFIPGNSGSHKQVRSLASVSLRKTLNSHAPFHFDYFTVDLNEEYSALFGGVLKDQRDFVHHCLHRILELYQYNKNKPSSVILIGHSMGGMVAKGLFLDPNFDKNLVRVIITLVTPHMSPVLALDSYIAKYYDQVNSYWIANRRQGWEGNLSHVTLASIGGGHRDILVRSGLTYAEEADINVVSTAMPTVWRSTDHLCSVWCKELVLVIVRALHDIVNLTTKQVTENALERKLVFQYHMLQRTAGKRFSTAFHPREAFFDSNAFWRENLQRQFTFHEPNGIHTETYIMIRLLDDPKHEMMAVEAVNVDDKDWVFACVADAIHNNARICSSGINLSNETQFIPSRQFQRKFIYLNLAALKRKLFTHVILKVKPTKEMVQFNFDIHSSSSRQVTVPLPKWLTFMSKNTVLDSTADRAGYYELALPGFEQVWQAYLLHIQPLDCQKSLHHAIAKMRVPWSKEDVHVHFTENIHKPLHLKLQSLKPLSYNSSDPVKVILILDPSCKYSVRIQSAILDSLGQLARFFSPMLLPYLVAILLLTMRHQLKSLVETGRCVMFHTALGVGAKPYYVLPPVRLWARVLGWSVLVKLVHPLLPLPDFVVLQEHNLDFMLLPIYLYVVAYGSAYLLGLACWLAVIFSGHTAHKMALRFIARTLTGTLTLSEWTMAGLSKLPAVLAAFLIALIYSTCGALSLCVGAAFFFLKLCKMYEDYLEDLFKYSLKLLLQRRKKSKSTKEQEGSEVKDNDSTKKEATATTCDNEIKTEVNDESKEQPIAATSNNETKGEPIASTTTDETKIEANDEMGKTIAIKSNEEIGTVDDNKEDNSVTATETQVESSTTGSGDNSEYCFSELHFNFTTLLLWLSVTLLNIPCVLVWAHSYKYNVKLEPDPSFETSVVLCFCAGILWQGKFPKPNLKYYNWVMHSLYVLSVLTLVYAPLSLHHLGPIVAMAFVVLTLHQVVASVMQTSNVDENPPLENQPSS
ncbi:GPI inositol-deacylase [Periplaneta americana]|uniref:GPI inositol-deacylase n=1 Tax=Periplaneta americana TaxID=6978 RepID=UPI0037E84AF8